MVLTPEQCQARLEVLAQRDPFLCQKDQGPQLAQRLQELDAALATALDETSQQLSDMAQKLNDELSETAAQLISAEEQLAEEFAELLPEDAPTSQQMARLAASIESRILWLYDRLRSRLDEALRRIEPQTRPIKDILRPLKEAWSASCRDMPEEILLILDRRQQKQLDGRCIWDLEGPALQDYCCKGHNRLIGRLLFHIQRQRLRRRYNLLHCELQETLNRHRPASLQKEFPAVLQSPQQAHEETTRKVADLWRNLRFNMEMAAEDCSQLENALKKDIPADFSQRIKKTADLVSGTLERTAEQITALDESFKNAWQQLLSELDQERHHTLELIARDLHRELSYGERCLHRLRRLGRRWKVRWNLWGARCGKPLQALFDRLVAVWETVRRRLGLQGGPRRLEEPLQQLFDLPPPREIRARAETLPPVCRRLFTIGALKNREFLVGEENRLKTLRDLFGHWEEGRLCSVAVVGPHGSGKTSLVNCFQSELGTRIPIHRVNIDNRLYGETQLIELCARWFELQAAPKDLADLEAQLCQLPSAVIIVENFHRLLLRTVGGLHSARAFLRLVLATRQHMLWVVTCRKYPWQRMQQLLHMDRYFNHQLHTLFGTQTEMRDALLLRVKTSGYPVCFLNTTDNGKRSQSPPGDQSSLQEQFFSDLFAASRGNMQAALYYWLLCLDYDSTLESLTVRPLGKLDYSFLRSFNRLQLYSLAETIAHGELRAAEHAAIFACDILQSRMLMDHLAQLNLLQYDSGDCYQLNPLFFAPVTATLEGRNILQ